MHTMSLLSRLTSALALSAALVACGDDFSSADDVAAGRQDAPDVPAAQQAGNGEQNSPEAAQLSAAVPLDVYKSPTCGCCVAWIDYINEHGFDSEVHHPTDLNAEKARLGVAPEYQSCHTAVTEEGYIFEGHIPARFIEQFLAQTPEGALGLAVPGMPLGSPGMEVGGRFTPYEVLLLKDDGSSEVFAEVSSMDEQ